MKTSNIYTQEQIKRVLVGSGVDIEAEFGNDFIIFCPYHNNNRTPAGEVAKDSGLFFCFGCQTTKNLEELKTLWDSIIKEQKTAKNKSYITPKEVQSVIKANSYFILSNIFQHQNYFGSHCKKCNQI